MKTSHFVQFCDDVRQEDNGKYILIGCYGDTMLVSNFPMSAKLQAFITFRTTNEMTHLNATLSLASGATIGQLRTEIGDNPYEYGEPSAGQLACPPFEISLLSEDEIVLHFWEDDEEPEEIGRLKIHLAPA